VTLLIASDVLGDDPAFVGSGPCTPDSLTAAKVWRLLDRSQLLDRVPASVRQYLDDVHHQRVIETPKPGSGVFRSVDTRVILSLRSAMDVAVRLAKGEGLAPVRVIGRPVRGEARRVGTELGTRLVAWRQQLRADGASGVGSGCTVAGGETTVTLGDRHSGVGGRCQELALATARELCRLRPRSDGITVLAAGTDGRDGPTDAAGAVVDAETWGRIIAAGRNPDDDLAAHDAYHGLQAAGALLRTGLTGTNLNDLILAVAPLTPVSGMPGSHA
jgi:glycerate-2-kinase